MRTLTIKRTKRFVAFLVKMKIYVEDPTSDEIVINKVPCRKLGTLKNGEEKSFQIDDGAAKVFAIADQLSKDYCNEYYQLPEGTEDIFLSGRNHFNPASGNAFRFDGNDNEEIIANRKKNNVKGVVVLIVSIIVGAILGFLIANSLF